MIESRLQDLDTYLQFNQHDFNTQPRNTTPPTSSNPIYFSTTSYVNQPTYQTRYNVNTSQNLTSELKDLPVFRYRNVDKRKSRSCPICLEEYQIGELIPYFHCEHYLHYHCFKECYQNCNKSHFDCPICRQKVMSQPLVNIAKQKRRDFLKRTSTL